jgi:hypothetical protein
MTDKSQDDPGEKKLPQRLGVREIAKRVGVAPMTVSRVLSNPDMVSPETRAKCCFHRAGGFSPTGWLPACAAMAA